MRWVADELQWHIWQPNMESWSYRWSGTNVNVMNAMGMHAFKMFDLEAGIDTETGGVQFGARRTDQVTHSGDKWWFYLDTVYYDKPNYW